MKPKTTASQKTSLGVAANLVTQRSLGDFGTRSMGIYADEVNLARAVPDLIDGLKPVQRRILWAASNLGKDFVKTARVVGECFAEGTLVTLATGGQVPIEEILRGDVVKTDVGPKEVTELYVLHNKDLYEVDLGDCTVQATPDQIFFCVDAAGNEVERTPLTLRPGDRVKSY